MNGLYIPPLEVILPRDIKASLVETVEYDTMRPGVVQEIREGKLVPIATFDGREYLHHDFVSPEQARERFQANPLVQVLPLREWYDSMEL